jgi:predicted Fe-Mo cluster-binding NifX family protein
MMNGGSRTVKIAVITDDGETLSRHFGRARQYLVATVEEGRVLGTELRDKAGHHSFNPSDQPHGGGGAHGFDPASRDRHARMLATIADCQVLLAGGMGQGMYLALEQAGIRPVLTEVDDIRQAIRGFLEGRLVERPDLAH